MAVRQARQEEGQHTIHDLIVKNCKVLVLASLSLLAFGLAVPFAPTIEAFVGRHYSSDQSLLTPFLAGLRFFLGLSCITMFDVGYVYCAEVAIPVLVPTLSPSLLEAGGPPS